MNQTAANVLMLARDYDGAIEVLRKTLDLDAHFAAANSVLGFVYTFKGRYEDALAQCEKVSTLASNPAVDASIKALKGFVYAVWGKRNKALKMIEEVSDPPAASPYSIAGIYAALGQSDQAFQCLNRAHAARSFQMVSLKVDPSFDNIRSDPRFEDFLRRVGFPLY
jgi:adenylate cyclase